MHEGALLTCRTKVLALLRRLGLYHDCPYKVLRAAAHCTKVHCSMPHKGADNWVSEGCRQRHSPDNTSLLESEQ